MTTPAASKNTRFFTIDDVAEHVQVSTKTVRRWIDRGELVVHRLGSHVRVGPDDFTAFLEARRKA